MVDSKLSEYRDRIDVLDERLIRLLAERFEITKAVGAHKADIGLPAADPQREQVQIQRLQALARDVGMDAVFHEKVFRLIVDEVIRHHERLAESSMHSEDN